MLKSNNKEQKSAVGIVIFIVFLVLAAVIFSVISVVSTSQTVMDLPQIKISIPNKEGTQANTVTAKFSLKTKDKKFKTVNYDEINANIIKAMQDIDFNQLSDENGVDYVKAVVKENLIRTYGDVIDDIYISDFINDVKIPAKEEQENSKDSKVSDTLKSFANTKK